MILKKYVFFLLQWYQNRNITSNRTNNSIPFMITLYFLINVTSIHDNYDDRRLWSQYGHSMDLGDRGGDFTWAEVTLYFHAWYGFHWMEEQKQWHVKCDRCCTPWNSYFKSEPLESLVEEAQTLTEHTLLCSQYFIYNGPLTNSLGGSLGNEVHVLFSTLECNWFTNLQGKHRWRK